MENWVSICLRNLNHCAKKFSLQKSPSLSQSLEMRQDSCKHIIKILKLSECSWLIAAASWMNSCEPAKFKWLTKQISIQTCPNLSQSLQFRWVVLGFAAPHWKLMPFHYVKLLHYLHVKSLCPTNTVQLTLRTSNYQTSYPRSMQRRQIQMLCETERAHVTLQSSNAWAKLLSLQTSPNLRQFSTNSLSCTQDCSSIISGAWRLSSNWSFSFLTCKVSQPY